MPRTVGVMFGLFNLFTIIAKKQMANVQMPRTVGVLFGLSILFSIIVKK